MKKKCVQFYRLSNKPNASTITEHLDAFSLSREVDVLQFNIYYDSLDTISFDPDVIIFHYSLFGSFPFGVTDEIKDYVSRLNNPIKIYFFQDEYQFCQERFELLDYLGVDVIYTLLEEQYFDQVYGNRIKVKEIYQTLTGFVSQELKDVSNKWISKYSKTIDVSYRARSLPYFMGQGAQEKHLIAELFINHPNTSHLVTDISTDNSKRLYGDDWYQLLAKSKATLGVESGVSIFDLNNEVKPLVRKVLAENPDASFGQVQKAVLMPFENKIHYRAISPRIFEAAAFKVCMVMYEGHYQGIIEPNIHYIPLKKDLSNLDDVLAKLQKSEYVQQICNNAYHDLINSDRYSYQRFIMEFDRNLRQLLNEVSEETLCAE